MRDIVKTVSYATRATDERVTYLRIYISTSSACLLPSLVLPAGGAVRAARATSLSVASRSACEPIAASAAMGVVDWHNPPRRELVIWLTGEVEFETSDGDIRRLAAGSIVLAEDRTGEGHISRHPGVGQLVVHIDLC